MADTEYLKYKDPKQPLNTRIKDLVGRMTLEEKIGQMLQIERTVASADIVNKYYIGSLLSAGGTVPKVNATANYGVDMVNKFQKGALSTRLGILIIYGVDAVHGHNNVYNATIFPHNIGLGATSTSTILGDPQLVKKIGDATALEARATGVSYLFAPSIAVCRDPRWGRCYKSYSEDHKIVQAMTEIILGLQGDIPPHSRKGVPYVAGNKKVAACAKHYVGDGGTTKGINENNTVITRHELLSIHMPAYYDSIIKGVSTIMGFVMSDFFGIDKITSPPHANYTHSIEVGVNAGIYMVMTAADFREFIDGLSLLVKTNVVSMKRINDAVKRILRVKFEHRELAREAVRKSLVLLKNGESVDKPLLPLPKMASKILVSGIHVDNLSYQCGGWTIQWQGLRSNNITSGTTILSAIKNTVEKDTKIVYQENPSLEYVKSNDFSYAIVVVGETPYAETNGDSLNLTISGNGAETINNVCSGVRCVVVLITGRLVVMLPYIDIIEGLVAAWLPGSEGYGITDVLFGDYGCSGKLPRTWFKSVDQLPMNVSDSHYDPLFPFGFGLTTQGLKNT
ncbi:uncharacterized protein LOC131620258 [Vicia villosa]|uniref:uncharacterized protein LOC131620258 n=1 Tax=Vicia villosa TaxID=3911 RepID=UPI00273AE060|nr:uncharacterized protein LOC131620258 [Vicia villosa]